MYVIEKSDRVIITETHYEVGHSYLPWAETPTVVRATVPVEKEKGRSLTSEKKTLS